MTKAGVSPIYTEKFLEDLNRFIRNDQKYENSDNYSEKNLSSENLAGDRGCLLKLSKVDLLRLSKRELRLFSFLDFRQLIPSSTI